MTWKNEVVLAVCKPRRYLDFKASGGCSCPTSQGIEDHCQRENTGLYKYSCGVATSLRPEGKHVINCKSDTVAANVDAKSSAVHAGLSAALALVVAAVTAF